MLKSSWSQNSTYRCSDSTSLVWCKVQQLMLRPVANLRPRNGKVERSGYAAINADMLWAEDIFYSCSFSHSHHRQKKSYLNGSRGAWAVLIARDPSCVLTSNVTQCVSCKGYPINAGLASHLSRCPDTSGLIGEPAHPYLTRP